MIKNYVKVPKLPLNNKAKLNKDKSLDVMNSIDLSNIVKKESEQSTNIKKQLIDSNNKNDESVYAPAFIIGEKDPEWDSFLDDTKVDVTLFFNFLIAKSRRDKFLLKRLPRLAKTNL